MINDINKEQPGRIVHEYWNPIPERMITARWPVLDKGYFGAFDATFLYLIILARVDAYFDDRALLKELWPNVEAILQWMLDWSDLDADGRVEYKKRKPEGIGLDNEVWKDSGESVRAPNQQPLIHPVAWIEVQGYAWSAYAAYITLAKKLHRLDFVLEQTIQQRMQRLQAGLKAFWMEDEHFPAMALDGNKQQIPIVATNAGHLLWSQCIEQTELEPVY
ncbi:MAG: glucosidase family protein [Ktedonobacteraceae bacterium]